MIVLVMTGIENYSNWSAFRSSYALSRLLLVNNQIQLKPKVFSAPYICHRLWGWLNRIHSLSNTSDFFFLAHYSVRD